MWKTNRLIGGIGLVLLLCGGCKSPSSRATVDGPDSGGPDLGVEAAETLESIDDQDDGDASLETDTADMASEPGEGDDHQLCMNACKIAAEVPECPVPLDTCQRDCDIQFVGQGCLPELRVLLRCQTSAGPEGYFCVTGGITIKPAFCAAERNAHVLCSNGDGGM